MNLAQATELYTGITTCRPVEEMNIYVGAANAKSKMPGCFMCECVRHGLYAIEQGRKLDDASGFSRYFGCTYHEACSFLFVYNIRERGDREAAIVAGENYYQAGKALIQKYGHWDAVNAGIHLGKSEGVETDGYDGVEYSSRVPIKITHEPSTMSFEQCMDELKVTIKED